MTRKQTKIKRMVYNVGMEAIISVLLSQPVSGSGEKSLTIKEDKGWTLILTLGCVRHFVHRKTLLSALWGLRENVLAKRNK